MRIIAGLAFFFLAAKADTQPCTLSAEVLRPYASRSATYQELADSRLRVSDFMTRCGMAGDSPDSRSRSTFFALVDREFSRDHRPELREFASRHPDSEALFEGLSLFHDSLKRFIDTIVTADDFGSREVILRYGNGRAIAALGPPVRKDVIRLLGAGHRFHGIGGKYSQQEQAFVALGYWIAPDNPDFSSRDRSEFAAILTRLLIAGPEPRNEYHARQLFAVLHALGSSDDPSVENQLRRWILEHGKSRSGSGWKQNGLLT